MEEDELIEYLNEILPDWRDHFDTPWDAADAMEVCYTQEESEDYRELFLE